jgi:hypothetical protein
VPWKGLEFPTVPGASERPLLKKANFVRADFQECEKPLGSEDFRS